MSDTNTSEILLIEDNLDDMDLIIRALKKNIPNLRYRHAENGKEALDFLFSDNAGLIKLIIADIKMPLVNGFEVIKEMKSDEKRKIIPIVILSSSTDEHDIKTAYELGVNAYVVKPIEYSKFTDTLTQISKFWLQMNQFPGY